MHAPWSCGWPATVVRAHGFCSIVTSAADTCSARAAARRKREAPAAQARLTPRRIDHAPWGAPPRSAPQAPRRTAPRCSAGAAASPRNTPARGTQLSRRLGGMQSRMRSRRAHRVLDRVGGRHVAVVTTQVCGRHVALQQHLALPLHGVVHSSLAPHARHADARLAVRMLGQVHGCCCSGRANALSCAGGTHPLTHYRRGRPRTPDAATSTSQPSSRSQSVTRERYEYHSVRASRAGVRAWRPLACTTSSTRRWRLARHGARRKPVLRAR